MQLKILSLLGLMFAFSACASISDDHYYPSSPPYYPPPEHGHKPPPSTGHIPPHNMRPALGSGTMHAPVLKR